VVDVWATREAEVGMPAENRLHHFPAALHPIELPLNRGVMAADGFHPGVPVYRVCGTALAEHIAENVWPRLRP
jgi:hypothetical protein